MGVFGRIVVPTDFSDSADRAFELALMIGRAHRSEVHLLHDLETPVETIVGATTVGDRIQRETEEALRRIDERVASAGASDVVTERVVERSTNPVHAIPLYASAHDIDLIVMGAHGHHSLNEKLMGSRAERVLREAPCPVITVTAQDGYTVPDQISHVLVPVDPSEPETNPVDTARAIASPWNARVTVLQADASDAPDDGSPELRARLMRQGTTGPALEFVTSSDPPAEAILDMARGGTVDLIVMFTHARKGVQRLWKGSVAEEVVPRATCPVLAVPPA